MRDDDAAYDAQPQPNATSLAGKCIFLLPERDEGILAIRFGDAGTTIRDSQPKPPVSIAAPSIVTALPSGLNLMALPTTFMMTWRIRRGSTET